MPLKTFKYNKWSADTDHFSCEFCSHIALSLTVIIREWHDLPYKIHYHLTINFHSKQSPIVYLSEQ